MHRNENTVSMLVFVILAIMLLIYLFFHDHFLYKFILAILTPAYTIWYFFDIQYIFIIAK